MCNIAKARQPEKLSVQRFCEAKYAMFLRSNIRNRLHMATLVHVKYELGNLRIEMGDLGFYEPGNKTPEEINLFRGIYELGLFLYSEGDLPVYSTNFAEK